MPTGVIRWRTEIPRHIAGGKSNLWIACEINHGRNLIQEICHGPNSPSGHLTRNDVLGATRNVTTNWCWRSIDLHTAIHNWNKRILHAFWKDQTISCSSTNWLPTRSFTPLVREHDSLFDHDGRRTRGMTGWDKLTMCIVNLLAVSMLRKMQKLCSNRGDHIDYETCKLAQRVISNTGRPISSIFSCDFNSVWLSVHIILLALRHVRGIGNQSCTASASNLRNCSSRSPFVSGVWLFFGIKIPFARMHHFRHATT
jgi:hypothetical protein